MPIYEYLCSSCNKTSESLEKVDVADILCPLCNGLAPRIMSATPGFVIGGCSNRVSLSRRREKS